jgi:dTMP kinase
VFISFEGVGGAGKTTQAALLTTWLNSQGFDTVLTREPGGTDLGEQLRTLLLQGSVAVAPRAEAALFAAARAQLVEEVVKPALARGAVVICDRFVDSSLVYQGVVEGVGGDAVLRLNEVATDGLLPDITFLLIVDVDLALERRRKTDRIEPKDHGVREHLETAYRELSARYPSRIVEIDAGGPAGEVAERVRAVVEERMISASGRGR